MTPQETIVSPCICGDPLCEIPYGYCHCRCGERTVIAARSFLKIGIKRGMPTRFKRSHGGAAKIAIRLPEMLGEIDGEPVRYIPMPHKQWAIIDVDLDISKFRRWYNSHGYVVTRDGDGNEVRLHHVVCPPADNKEPDHWNGNRQDNRKSNLRLVERFQNCENSAIRKDNKTGVKGVQWIEDRQCYRAEITFKKKVLRLGHFKIFEDAVRIRLAKELELFGEYSRLSRKGESLCPGQ